MIQENTATIATVAGQVVVAVAVAATTAFNHFKGKRRDRSQHAHIDAQFTEQRQYMDGRFNTVEVEMAELRAFVVGPDGENGLRGDVREIKDKVRGLEDRERTRLEPRDVGALDPRSRR